MLICGICFLYLQEITNIIPMVFDIGSVMDLLRSANDILSC